jgi:outer membrane protein OmpA-like peptidoglycan-associated protein
MKSRCLSVVAVLAGMLLFSLLGFAQDEETKKITTAASLDGTSGLFKTWDAENLRKGEANFTFGWDQYHRDPGKLTIGKMPVGIALGVIDRIEFFDSWDVVEHVRARNIATYRRPVGSPLALPIPAMTPVGITYFSQDAPFMDVPTATDRGDVHLGVKFNILSERRGNGLSLGLAGFAALPGHRDAIALSRGLSTGAFEGGFALLFSKTAAKFARFHVNLGMNTYTNPKVGDVEVANLANEFIYRAGMDLPIQKSVHLIAEMDGRAYYGSSSPPGLNYKSPVDLIFGMRVFPRDWFSLGAGYQLTLNHIEENTTTWVYPSGHNGFVVQGAFASRRNDAPTASCSVDKASIIQGEKAKVAVAASDPDQDKLTYEWSGTGVKGSGAAATFDATGLAPGTYTVKATVKDKKHMASCSSDVTVLKRNHTPPASIEPTTFNLTQGESQDFHCKGTDPENDRLTYSWTVEGQKLAAAGPDITFGSEGRNPGSYSIVCSASDGEFSASATAKGTVRGKPTPPPPANKPPSIECQTSTVDLWSGESKELRAKASDPDGDNLTYSWSGTGVKGSGATAKFDATGVKAGSYTVNVTVDDGRGGKASCAMTVNVSERLSVTKDNKCGFFKPGAYRVDNCAKAILDDLSVRMQNDSKLHANIIGYTDQTEKVKKLGERRAKAVEEYLEKKGVAASRMTVTDGGANNPAGDNKIVSTRMLNRRVEIELTVK